jgi:hypothetical protein
MNSPPESEKLMRRRLAAKGGDEGELKIKTIPQNAGERVGETIRSPLINLGARA